MTDTTIFLYRKMLVLLDAIGPAGLEEDTIKAQAEIAAGQLVTTVDKNLAFATLKERNWIASYTDELTNRVRWFLTAQGKTIRAGL